MSDPRSKDRRRITLEQLLQLKRSERPTPAFWEDFDRELRRRQLACIVAGQPWYVRFIRGITVGFRRAAPVGVAAAAAVAGFLVLQRQPHDTRTIPMQAMSADTTAFESSSGAVTESTPTAVETPAIARDETPVPAFVRPSVGEARFVVHEFVASANPSRTFVSVTSPNTFSSPAYDESLQLVNTLTADSARRAATQSGAGSF